MRQSPFPDKGGPLVGASDLLAAMRRRGPKPALFDCRYDLGDGDAGLAAYRAGHLPGAHHASLGSQLSGESARGAGRHPWPRAGAVADWLGSCGVDRDRPIVAYDDSGGLFAARLWWLLLWLGHRGEVRVLDGGLAAWRHAGGGLTSEPTRVAPVAYDWRPRALRHHLLASDEALRQALSGGRERVLDVRAAERYRGEVEPMDPVAGHMPGAVNLPAATLLAPDGRFLPPDGLAARFATVLGSGARAIAPRHTIHSCGSGVTACQSLLALAASGLDADIPTGRLYAPSWSGWIDQDQPPVAIGAEPGVLT